MAKKDDEREDEDEDEEEISGEEASRSKAAAMVLWTKRLAFFLGFCAFVVMFLVSYDFENYFDTMVIVIATMKGFAASLVFWLVGLILGNIFLKGLITDIPVNHEHLIDGGLLQRIYLYQQRLNYDQDGNVIQVDPRTDTIVRSVKK
ncbi:MAG: hypothetical protein FWC23_05515 [Chitinispirillia bacterium]|nr:hypothetical protein [Chitinispirillia bacterium]MCL2268626.1 hypothetical protein [Chitinispirillia bacterium]